MPHALLVGGLRLSSHCPYIGVWRILRSQVLPLSSRDTALLSLKVSVVKTSEICFCCSSLVFLFPPITLVGCFVVIVLILGIRGFSLRYITYAGHFHSFYCSGPLWFSGSGVSSLWGKLCLQFSEVPLLLGHSVHARKFHTISWISPCCHSDICSSY